LYLHSYVVGDRIPDAVLVILWICACYCVWWLQILNVSFILTVTVQFRETEFF